jgi:NADPH-dependent glutamate synthase beta subunit-like oxidoreductase
VGGGYTAMDCSRTSLRHGARNVTIAYRRTRSELVVDEEELGETEREGVRMEFLASPVEILGDEDGNITGVRFIRNRLGEPDATGRRAPGAGSAWTPARTPPTSGACSRVVTS